MVILKTLYALGYVAAQLSYRWLPPPRLEEEDQEVARQVFAGLSGPLTMSESEFRDLAIWGARRRGRPVPWLVDFVDRLDPGASHLAKTAAAHFGAVRRHHAHWLSPLDPEFPPLLREIRDPPLGLTVLGDVRSLERPLVGVVGSRKASPHALKESFDLGRRLARCGASVVSGGAFGCDIAAHHGVLAAGVRPVPAVCVFAGGLDVLYPIGNTRVFNSLRDGGAVLVSERLWDSACRPLDFRGRNRLIAGMSGLMVVMQAAKRSGALVTARLALDNGRDIAILRHPEGDVRAEGGLALIAEGATPFENSEDLMAHMRLDPCPITKWSSDPNFLP